MSRLSRDALFMGIAQLVALRGTCETKQVGALLVKENRVISTGYNGSPSGAAHCTEVGCWRPNPDQGCQRTIHAEANAILFAAKQGISTKGAKLYVTMSPCLNCAKLIVNAGISEVIYLEEYRDITGVEYLDLLQMPIRRIEDGFLFSQRLSDFLSMEGDPASIMEI